MTIGMLMIDRKYPYIHPFYKSLSKILRVRDPASVTNAALAEIIALETDCLASEPSLIVGEYWDPWWSVDDVVVGDMLDGFRLYHSQVGASRSPVMFPINAMPQVLDQPPPCLLPSSTPEGRLEQDLSHAKLLVSYVKAEAGLATMQMMPHITDDVSVMDALQRGGSLPYIADLESE